MGRCRYRGLGETGSTCEARASRKKFYTQDKGDVPPWGRSVEGPISDSAPRPLSSLENPKFPGILARLEESPVCQRLPLTSFLILPFQRVTRLKMLVEVAHFRQGREGELVCNLWSVTF